MATFGKPNAQAGDDNRVRDLDVVVDQADGRRTVSRTASSRLMRVASNGLGKVAGTAGDNLAGLRDFVLRDTLVDTAVGIVIGTSFTMLINTFIRSLVTPWISAIFGSTFMELAFYVNGSKFTYGEFINQLITFTCVVSMCYFFVIRPLKAILAAMPGGNLKKPCQFCYESINKKATVCKCCTRDQPVIEEEKDI